MIKPVPPSGHPRQSQQPKGPDQIPSHVNSINLEESISTDKAGIYVSGWQLNPNTLSPEEEVRLSESIKAGLASVHFEDQK